MSHHNRDSRGFTLIELIASITIVAILAVVALPSATMATPYQQIGYADVVAASLRQAREVAIATTCDVRFTIDNAGYRAQQRASAGTHCAANGNFTTPVLSGTAPSGVRPAAGRTVVFTATGETTGGSITINIGPQVISIDTDGVVSSP